MLSIICNLCNSLDFDLKQIDLDNSDILKKAELSILRINDCLKKLRAHILSNKFPSQKDEIQFFKEVKPSIYSKLIYFVQVYNIESKRPTGSDKSQRKYLQSELKKLEAFFSENLEFYQYMRNNLDYLDDKYFVRGKLDIRLFVDSFIYEADPEFSTSHDYKASKILANDLLCVYLKSELAILDRKENNMNKNTFIPKGKYAWTDNKISLTELIYALHSARSINNGNIDIKELAKLVEYIFNVDLGDYYRDYLQMKGRQSPTRYIDTLKNALTNRINEQEE